MKQLIIILLIQAILLPGSQVRAETGFNNDYMEILPNGRTTGSILENWMNNIVFFQVESGGLSRIDLPRFSPDGISWIEQNFRINGVDITDPLMSGYPLFEPAWESIKSVQIRSVQENDPHHTGLNWITFPPEDKNKLDLSYNTIFPFYDASLIPEGTLDREPSFNYGSPDKTRRYKMSKEADCNFKITDNISAGLEALVTEREFPTLTHSSGNYDTENAARCTLTTSYKNNNFIPCSILFISQYNQNNNYGANLRLDEEDTLTQHNYVNHLQCSMDKGKLHANSGITVKTEKLDSHLSRPKITELISDSCIAPEAGKTTRANFDNNFVYEYNSILNFEAELQVNAVNYKPEIPYSQTMMSYNGSIYSVTVWDNVQTCNEYVTNTKLKTGLTKTWDSFNLSGNLYIDNAYAAANGSRLLNWYGLGGKISSKYSVKKTDTALTLSVLHQPAKLNSYIIEFLDNDRPSGLTYANWADSNMNNIADESELAAATLVSSTGGEYHYKDSNLKRPYHDEITFAIEQPLGNQVKIVLHGTHRIFSDYFIVNYGSYNGTYTTTSEGYSIYNKTAGIDNYYLSNYTGKPAHYSGAGIQFQWESGKTYLNFMFRAFMVKGYAASGNGPDYNDYAVISEDTASPNSRINADGGRLSSDRAYMANILYAYRIRKDLTFGLTLKYRDGEPYSQYRVYYDSNGMPVKVMNQTRGDWYNQGIGRYTFAWNMDIRLRYTPNIYANTKIGFTLDIYNVLGSSTEILESSDFEDDRLALEAVPQRMIKLGADMRF